MHIAVTGAAGFLGQRLIRRLLEREQLRGQPISRLTLLDQVQVEVADSEGVEVVSLAVDITAPRAFDELLDERPDVIYHLAAVVSSAAEDDLDLGLAVNLDATRALLEGCRQRDLSATRLVMASSVAAYGGELPDTLDDMTALHPQNSYGAQKAVSELLINDYSRRGLIDGLVLRLPTIAVRPGRPNAAASSFVSSIMREPLNGEEAVCPVPTDLELFVMSPDKVVKALVHGAEIDGETIGPFRAFMLPGITVSVGQMIETLGEVAGPQAIEWIRHEPDSKIQSIVGSWPTRFHTQRADVLGFERDRDFRDILQAFQEERH
ncbi:MAG: SDR family oxidoreductase [Halomonas sp.]|uniref:D-erythronate dehydrogenase n=1 Tax=Halomonas TaxID=2745 RepID=UPI000485AE6F|nr:MULTISPECIES: D-erythronate dehydrogenase [Halomonas]NWN81678.1 SDR family oxidoreductase [Halomonas sp.]